MHSGCILCGGVGSGKSLTALGFCKKEYGCSDIYVITTSKKRDSKEWETDAEKLGISVKVVDSWNNIRKYIGVKNAFFVFDEQKVSGHGKWSRRMISITKNNKWILLTATPGDNWDAYATVFIANKYVRSRTEWLDVYCRLDPHVNYQKIIGYNHEDRIRIWVSQILVTMEYVSEKNKHEIFVECESKPDLERYVLTKRQTPDGSRPFVNIGGAIIYARMTCPESECKIAELQKIIQVHGKVIVFYNFISEKYDIEKAALNMGVLYKQCNGQVHDPIPVEEKWVYAVNYGSGAEGWNCPQCSCVAFYSLSPAYWQMVQAAGRIDRVNSVSNDLYYYYMVCPDLITDRIIRRTLSRKEDFNERVFEKEWNTFAYDTDDTYLRVERYGSGAKTVSPRESVVQAKLIHEIETKIPDCVVLKNDAKNRQGIPDLSVMCKNGRYAFLEVKRDSAKSMQSNQEYYLNFAGKSGGYGKVVSPENMGRIITELTEYFYG